MIEQLKQVVILAKTIDHGSFRGAARELRLSPSVISHHISQLEEHLGHALIYRSTRKLTLTREGEKLLLATRSKLDAIEEELQNLSENAPIPSGELNLTLPSVLSRSELTARITEFSQTYPRIRLSLDYSDAKRSIIDDGFDLAVSLAQNAKNSSTTRILFNVERILVAAPSYLSSRLNYDHPSDLEDWDWLALAPNQIASSQFQHKDGQVVKIKPDTRILTNDAQSLYRLARSGAGIAIVPDFLAKEDLADRCVQQILSEWELPPLHVYVTWPTNAPKHGLIHLMLDVLSKRN